MSIQLYQLDTPRFNFQLALLESPSPVLAQGLDVLA
jgi:hypothetical protein